ncbi:MAG: hypothetical protein NC928_01165 [Candidatus Omnitrophica bacterium]|nr:hypothetical protein [Candidatus Omnitrophota bacterium]
MCKKSLILGMGICLVLSNLVFAQETETEWVWGEVKSIDTQKKEILLKYLDYDTDEEKEITISVNEYTVFENVKSLDEIKLNDALSIDYVTTAEGKNLAKNISVEKFETTEDTSAPLEETIPESQ